MHRSTPIPAWVDGGEMSDSVGAGHLVAPEELLAWGVESRIADIRVDPQRVAMSDIDNGIG